MILFIHTADLSKVRLMLVKPQKIAADIEFEAQYRQAEKLLPAIAKLLQATSCKPQVIKAIGVVTGPGPFTALRIGIATANTLGWALGKPVFGVRLDQFNKAADAGKFIEAKSKSAKLGAIIEPFYGKEPNLTVRKVGK